MNRQERRRLERKENEKRSHMILLLSLSVLHEQFGFGEKRLGRFNEEMQKKIESLDTVRLPDLVEEIERITGWRIQL